ncbi:class I SAM-dependent methyltransferase [Aspergillus undulatus]|uniref:class I SAM-dependent methyltransferase n=1 Tax=Aspergillus undulatus TaxID=1810928 RepID=UPI003CCE48DC
MPTLNSTYYDTLSLTYESAFAHDTVLDNGCGTGKPVLSTLHSLGHDVMGLDLSPAMVEKAKKNVPRGRFVVGDMRGFEYHGNKGQEGQEEGGKLDAIFAVLSLFPFTREEISSLVLKWTRWLGVGGLLCICTLTVDNMPKESLRAGYGGDGLCVQGITSRFMGEEIICTCLTKEGWRVLLRGMGFEIVDERTDSFIPPKWAECDPESHFFVIASKV